MIDSEDKIKDPRFPEFLQSGGEAGRLIRETDWDSTKIGPIESWPLSLKLALGIMLANKFGMYIAWGRDYTQFYNDGYRPILGSTKHPQAMGNTAKETFAESWHIIMPLFQKVLQGEAVGSEDWLLPLNRHGYLEDCYFTFSYSPIRDEEGKVGGVLVTVMETTQRVLSESKLKLAIRRAEQAEKSLENIFLQAPVGIAALSGSDHVFTFANPRYMELLFGRHKDILGKSVASALPEVVEQGFVKLLDEVYLSQKQFEGKELPIGIVQCDGLVKNIFVNFSYGAIVDESGRSTGILVVVYEVTEQVKAREKLQESELRFRALANTIPQLAWMTDSAGRITWYNQNWYDYTGSTFEDMEGWGWQVAHHPEHLERVVDRWKHHLSSGEPWEDTFPLKSHNGEWRWFLSRARATFDEHGKIIHWFGTNTDIEVQLRSIEAAEAANKSKSEFLANMSHEIRTPLGAILGFSALLEDPLLTIADRTQFLEIINRNGEALSRIIDDILDLAKVEAGKIEIEETELNVREFFNEVLNVFKDKSAQKGIDLRLLIQDDFPKKIKSDPVRLRQILLNLVGNAVKFTEAGYVEVKVGCVSRKTDSIQIAIEVLDTGIGLLEEQRERIFQPFAQADSSTTRRFGGTGLGLALSQRLSQALGGDIAIDNSTPGMGSKFSLRFSSKVLDDSSQTEVTNQPVKPTREALGGANILVIDDSPDNLLLIKKILTCSGATVELASDGYEGLTKAKAGTFDVILMDIQMPGLDGYQVLRTLLASGCLSPVIALTAHAMTEERNKTKEAGFVDHITKPIASHVLVDAICTTLLKSRLQC